MEERSDMECSLTFIDVDDNRLELWLAPDRIRLAGADSRPELDAGELRRFAAVVFGRYVAPDLAARLSRAHSRLCEARDRAGGDELAVALDGALRAIEDLAEAVAVPEPAPAPAATPELEADAEPAIGPAMPPALEPATPPAMPPAMPIVLPSLTGRQPYPLLSRRKATRGTRAKESGATSSSCRPR